MIFAKQTEMKNLLLAEPPQLKELTIPKNQKQLVYYSKKSILVLEKVAHVLCRTQKMKHVCRICLNCYSSANVRFRHQLSCLGNDYCILKFPVDRFSGWNLHFQNFPDCFKIYVGVGCSNEKNEGNSNKRTNTFIFKL